MVIKSVDRLTGLVPHGLTHILCFEKKKTEKKTKEKTAKKHVRLSSTVRSKKLSITKGKVLPTFCTKMV